MADIIPLILSEEVAGILPDDILAKLAECSTAVVCKKVVDYLNKPDVDKDVQEKVRKAYQGRIAVDSFLSDEVIVNMVEKIKNLSYSNITPNLTLEELEVLRTAIITILNSPYAVPYIAPIQGSIIKELRMEVKDFAKEEGSYLISDFGEKLEKFSHLFRDSQHEAFKGTICKTIIRNKEKYSILLRGIEFQIAQKKAGNKPASWRFL